MKYEQKITKLKQNSNKSHFKDLKSPISICISESHKKREANKILKQTFFRFLYKTSTVEIYRTFWNQKKLCIYFCKPNKDQMLKNDKKKFKFFKWKENKIVGNFLNVNVKCKLLVSETKYKNGRSTELAFLLE